MEGGLQLLHEGSLWWREEGREGGREGGGWQAGGTSTCTCKIKSFVSN